MKLRVFSVLCAMLCAACLLLAQPAAAADSHVTPMYRLYNPNSGEHFYTGSTDERENLTAAGWHYEGVAWNAPVRSGEAVFRMFNPNSGDHHYTMSPREVDDLLKAGWQYEGICWNSASGEGAPQYRLYNPNADLGSHHYTGSMSERQNLVRAGWIYEGIGWYGASGGHIHGYTAVVTPPTCTAEGYTTYTCSCGDSYRDNPTAPAHSWSPWTVTVRPTPDTVGSRHRSCSACGLAETENIIYSGTQASEFLNMSYQQIIETVGPLFTENQRQNRILASVSLAQFILESGYGKSGLTQVTNNCFGIKATIGYNWAGSTWDGVSMHPVETEEYINGQWVTVTANFRKYASVEDSIADHAAYLLNVKNGGSLRYEGLQGCMDYRQAITIIKNGGYATSPTYVDDICRIIEQRNLTRFDLDANGNPVMGDNGRFPAVPFRVEVLIEDLNYRSGPSTDYVSVGYAPKGVCTIVETSGSWGKLESGRGWIYLGNSAYCKVL